MVSLRAHVKFTQNTLLYGDQFQPSRADACFRFVPSPYFPPTRSDASVPKIEGPNFLNAATMPSMYAGRSILRT